MREGGGELGAASVGDAHEQHLWWAGIPSAGKVFQALQREALGERVREASHAIVEITSSRLVTAARRSARTRYHTQVPRRSASSRPTSLSTFRWCEIVG